MTPDQIHLLRKSFSRVEPRAQIASLSFYRRLFELAPELMPLFRTSIEEQSAKLVEMLSFAVNFTDKKGSLEMELRQLGARHVIYGVEDKYYDVAVRALMEMLEEVLGPAFTPPVREVWTAFFAFTVKAMKEGAAVYHARDAAAQAAAAAGKRAHRET